MKDKMKDKGSRSKGHFHSTYLNILIRAKDDISLKKGVKTLIRIISQIIGKPVVLSGLFQ